MEAGPPVWAALRDRLTALLSEGASEADLLRPHLVRQLDATMHMPFLVSEFTDFYAGKHHATNVGTMFRGAENALPSNWLHMPIGYNGRASTVVVSGTAITRPNGQIKSPDSAMPTFSPCARLDFELELGAIVGAANPMGTPVSVQEADDMIFGYVLFERLVGAGRANMGIPAAWPVSGQGLRDLDQPVDRNQSRAGAFPHRHAHAGERPAALPARTRSDAV